MSVLSKHRFYTPKRVKKIKLDLISLEGGGGCPAQFDGKTRDDREVYCRYSGGALRVDISEKMPGGDTDCDWGIFHELVGPPHDSVMTQGQLCEVTGITVNGSRPALDLCLKHDIYDTAECHGFPCDLSGNTTFYGNSVYATKDTQDKFFTAILSTIDQAAFVQEYGTFTKIEKSVQRKVLKHRKGNVFDTIRALFGQLQYVNEEQILTSHDYDFHGIREFSDVKLLKRRESSSGVRWYLFLADPKEDMDLGRIQKSLGHLDHYFPEKLVIRVLSHGQHDRRERRYSKNQVSLFDEIKQAVGRPLYQPGDTGECITGYLGLISCFSKKNALHKRTLKRVDKLFDEFFPKFRTVGVNILDGTIIPDSEKWTHIDPLVVEWCKQDQDRFLSLGSGFTRRDEHGKMCDKTFFAQQVLFD